MSRVFFCRICKQFIVGRGRGKAETFDAINESKDVDAWASKWKVCFLQRYLSEWTDSDA